MGFADGDDLANRAGLRRARLRRAPRDPSTTRRPPGCGRPPSRSASPIGSGAPSTSRWSAPRTASPSSRRWSARDRRRAAVRARRPAAADDRLAIEASAGTGKTHTLVCARGALRDRGTMSRSRSSSSSRSPGSPRRELRDRLRGLLASAVDALADDRRRGSGSRPTTLLGGSVLGRRRRCASTAPGPRSPTSTRPRSRRSMASPSQVLGSLGTSASGDDDAALADDDGELLRQVCSDVLVAEGLARTPRASTARSRSPPTPTSSRPHATSPATPASDAVPGSRSRRLERGGRAPARAGRPRRGRDRPASPRPRARSRSTTS